MSLVQFLENALIRAEINFDFPEWRNQDWGVLSPLASTLPCKFSYNFLCAQSLFSGKQQLRCYSVHWLLSLLSALLLAHRTKKGKEQEMTSDKYILIAALTRTGRAHCKLNLVNSRYFRNCSASWFACFLLLHINFSTCYLWLTRQSAKWVLGRVLSFLWQCLKTTLLSVDGRWSAKLHCNICQTFNLLISWHRLQ